MKDIITTLEKHYYSSRNLINNSGYDTVSRAVSRFITLEKSLLRQLMLLEFDRAFQEKRAADYRDSFENYAEMLRANTELVKYLTKRTAAITDEAASSILSYWVAAMQIENDELARGLGGFDEPPQIRLGQRR